MTPAIQRRRRTFLGVTVAGALGAALTPHGCFADDTSAEAADQFKAAYLYNFAKFVVWPASAPADVLTICFRGAAGVYDRLARDVSGKLIGARRIVVRSLGTAQQADACNILYVDAAIESATNLVPGTPSFALTVSDAPEFTHHGGMIGLFYQGNRLRFDIDLQNARMAGLKISSNLLQLASKVEQETP